MTLITTKPSYSRLAGCFKGGVFAALRIHSNGRADAVEAAELAQMFATLSRRGQAGARFNMLPFPFSTFS